MAELSRPKQMMTYTKNNNNSRETMKQKSKQQQQFIKHFASVGLHQKQKINNIFSVK